MYLKKQGVVGVTEYTCDALGQLLTETVTEDGVSTVVNSMEYNGYGNIVKKNGKVYTYGDGAWKDLLTAYDGQTISYDAQGNPTSYLGHALTWEKGRQLKSFDGNTYTYNANGIRTSKTVNGVLHTYTLDGTKILREEWTDEYGTHTLTPFYDNEDNARGIEYDGTAFFFRKNLQGDVIALVRSEGCIDAHYVYDAWGNVTVLGHFGEPADDPQHIGNINPFRYRGYYYDAEIAKYYLQSRYYDAQTGRFVNGDTTELLHLSAGILPLNLYSYCCSNPLMLTDIDGFFGWSAVLAVGLTASLIGAISQIASNILAGCKGNKIFQGVFGAAIGSGVNATLLLLIPFWVPYRKLIAALAGGVAQALVDFLINVFVYKKKSWKQLGKDILINTAGNWLGNYLGNKAIKTNDGWFQPKNFKAIFKGSYGQKILAQTGIGGVIAGIINFMRKLFNF